MFQPLAVSADQPSLPNVPSLMQHLPLEAQAEITRLQILIAVRLRDRFGLRSDRLGEESVQLVIEDIEQSLGEQAAKIKAAQTEVKRPLQVNGFGLGGLVTGAADAGPTLALYWAHIAETREDAVRQNCRLRRHGREEWSGRLRLDAGRWFLQGGGLDRQ